MTSRSGVAILSRHAGGREHDPQHQNHRREKAGVGSAPGVSANQMKPTGDTGTIPTRIDSQGSAYERLRHATREECRAHRWLG